MDELSIDYSQGNVLLAWTIKSGSVCNGIQIYRSTDSLNFVIIENIDGACGDLASSVTYTYTDSEPINNKINYFKFELVFAVLSENLHFTKPHHFLTQKMYGTKEQSCPRGLEDLVGETLLFATEFDFPYLGLSNLRNLYV